ncbi:unnamed protein product [Rhizoctonia solani]|uniref:Laminin domain protein n=1 Tax=Rhizoctonia solani TaxID=456999 RepID=A0A8H3DPV2_9AGAM|nr:unnamed protein product [Rhizoctonia solani]
MVNQFSRLVSGSTLICNLDHSVDPGCKYLWLYRTTRIGLTPAITISSYPANQVLTPPDLPPYLENICKLGTIDGVPSNEQVIEIHTTIRVAHKVVDLQGMGDPVLLAQLSEHLFNAQMGMRSSLARCPEAYLIVSARYRHKYPCSIFPTHTTYTPPALPVHMPVKLEPISGPPSQEDIIKVHSAIQSYQKLTDIPSLFDPQVNADLSQHLFDIQMAQYIGRCSHAGPAPRRNAPAQPTGPAQPMGGMDKEIATSTNNPGRAAEAADVHQASPSPTDTIVREAIERSNQLAERSNQLIESSNQIVEQLIQAVGQSNQPRNSVMEKVTESLEQLNNRFERSNHLAEALTKPVEKLGNTLKNINKVLVSIQHAIVRNHKDNTLSAVDCLVNEEGETCRTSWNTFNSIISHDHSNNAKLAFPVVVDGIRRNCNLPDAWVALLLRFFGIGNDFFADEGSFNLKTGCEKAARSTLSLYLSSRLR